MTRGGFLELHETPSQLQKWVLSFQEIKDWCGSRVIAFLNSSRERRSVSFPKVEPMTGWEMEARNTKRKGAVEVVTFMASLFGRILIDLNYLTWDGLFFENLLSVETCTELRVLFYDASGAHRLETSHCIRTAARGLPAGTSAPHRRRRGCISYSAVALPSCQTSRPRKCASVIVVPVAAGDRRRCERSRLDWKNRQR